MDPAVLRLVVAALLVDAVAALGGPRHARGRIAWNLRAGAGTLDLVLDDDGAPAEPASLPAVRSLLAPHAAAIRHEPGDAAWQPGDGRRFRSRRAVRAAPAAPRPSSAAPPATTGPIVLVCDDDAVVRGLIVRSLARAGLRAIATGTAAEALAVIGREPVDVVLADARMAGMSGRELHARGRRDPPGPPGALRADVGRRRRHRPRRVRGRRAPARAGQAVRPRALPAMLREVAGG